LSYEIEKIEIDSQIFGFDCWNILNPCEIEDFLSPVLSIKEKGKPALISCKIPLSEPNKIKNAESAGFKFSEVQFRTRLGLKNTYKTEKYPYRYVKIQSEEQLTEVLEIAGTTFLHDRYTLDKKIGKALSGQRYARYLRKSFEEPDEEIWCVQSVASGKILTFRSHKIISDKEVLLLLGGVLPKLKGSGLGVVSSHFCFNQLYGSGFTHAITYVPATNIPILNLEIGHFKFRITESFLILSVHVN
jgi:hypothetical protein